MTDPMQTLQLIYWYLPTSQNDQKAQGPHSVRNQEVSLLTLLLHRQGKGGDGETCPAVVLSAEAPDRTQRKHFVEVDRYFGCVEFQLWVLTDVEFHKQKSCWKHR